MARLRREDMPLSTFDPRYREIILRGCREVVEIRQSSKSDAHRLANILRVYRARVRKEADPAVWEPLYGTIIGLSDDGFATRLRPRALEAEHLLRDLQIGGNIDADLEGTPLEVSAPLPSLDSDPLAEFDPDGGQGGKGKNPS